MTGAEKFADLLARTQFVYRDVPEHHRNTLLLNALPAGVVSLAAGLLQQHDYGGAHDVIILGFQTQMQLTEAVIADADEETREELRIAFRRFAGEDIARPSEAAPDSAAPDGNALSDEELRDLGLAPSAAVDVAAPPSEDR